MPQFERQFITKTHVWWFSLIMFCAVCGILAVFVNAMFLIATVFLIVNVILILKYPIWGLLSYLIIFLMRPGEMFPALAPLRVELLTGLLVILSLVLHQKYKTGKILLPRDNITLSLAAFLVVMCLTIFVSYEKSRTAQTIQDFIKLMIFYYLIVSVIDSRPKFVAFVTTFLLLIAYIAFDAFKMYAAGAFIHTMGVDRMSGSTSAGGDPNSLANTLASTIPFVVASAIYFKNYFVKFLLFLLALAMAVLITITASRGGLVAFLGVIGGFIFFSNKKVVLTVAVAVLLMVGWTALPDQYKQRYKTMTELEDIDQTSSGRWDIWVNGSHMIINHPILGVGAGAFAWANSSGDFGRPMFMQAHNLYIQILATTGLVGFFVWFIFIFNFSKNLRYLMNKVRGRPEHRWIRVYAVSFAICMISLFISGLFAHSLYRYTWYMMAGLTAVLTFLGDQVDQENIRTGETIESRQLQSK